MKGHGRTAKGTKRWQCMSCAATTTHKVDTAAKGLKGFLAWLLSPSRQTDMPGAGRSFRRSSESLWRIWPVAPVCDEVCHVVHVDGIWLGRKAVMLIACTTDCVVGWHLARSENSQAWAALMARIAPPDVVVSDGGSGFEKARRSVWPATRVQRCTFHAFAQVKRCTTTRPRLQAGVELYGIAKDLLCVKSLDEAARWLAALAGWCARWDAFLEEKVVVDGRVQFKHERLRKARRGLERLARAGTLFTYLDEELQEGGPVPATNNRIEGGVNAQLREMLRRHRGMSLERRIKAISWWCYLHTESPLPAAAILQTMPTDESITALYREVENTKESEVAIARWGTAVAWSDLHASGPWRSDWD